MENILFKALVVDEADGRFIRSIQTRSVGDLPEGDLLVRVSYSSLNYKDALSASGNKGVTKQYPHTPGIDAVGTVENSANPKFRVGDKVIVTSYDLGMNTAGGFGEYIRVSSQWAVHLPAGMTEKEAMIYGTAGLTAGMAIARITELVRPEDGPIAVSGATGGVGSLSIAILSKLGYRITAITGKESERELLSRAGATEIILRADFECPEKRPLLKPIFAGAVDTVGGTILENIIKSTKPMGVVACCGNVASPNMELTVFPFILRGVSLVGIDSQNFPMDRRRKVWETLAGEWKPECLAENCREVSLENLSEEIDAMLAGTHKGRTVIKL